MATLLVCVMLGLVPQMPLSLAGTDDALAVFANPAGLGTSRRFDCYYVCGVSTGEFWRNSALAANVGPVAGFWEPGGRYGAAAGFGQDGYFGGVRVVRDSATRVDLGAMWRPNRWLSAGAVWNDLNHGWGAVMAGVGLRPVGERLTLTADVLASAPLVPVLGLEAEPFNGLVLGAKVKPTDLSFNVGLTVNLGQSGFGGFGSRVGRETQAGALVRFGKEYRRGLVPGRKRLLEVVLSGSVADRRPGFSLMGSRPARTTWELLELVDRAGEDPQIAGMVLKLAGFAIGFAQAQELREALGEFRARGKKLYVYAQGLGMSGFYLASVADKVFCHPATEVVIPGVSATPMFLKGTLEKLGIEFEHQRSGEYKSAVEMFTEDSLTPKNREQLEALLDAGYEQFLTEASAGRGMTRERLEELVNQGFFVPAAAESLGLIDAVCYEDELEDRLKQEENRFSAVKEQKYLGRAEYEYCWHEPARIAVVCATGGIAPGESRTDLLTGDLTAGSKTLTKALRAARRDSRVKAVVLRVDSPGGDGFASDEIWREVRLAAEKKPVVVSMGNVAASGGYYISCGADRVFANPGTITGSIGGFSSKFVTEGLYNKLGVRRQVLKRGEHADAWSDVRGFTAEEDSMMQCMLDRFCDDFIQKVADGRGLTFEAVDSVAQGRVWIGSDALRFGLVDTLAGMMAAVRWAKAEAKLKDYDLVVFPKPKSGPGAWLDNMLGLSELRLW